MATKLYLRDTQTNGIGSTYFDMVTTLGPAVVSFVTNTVASGTQIQWTQSAGGALAQWISGRAPAGGFTLTSTDIAISVFESDMAANCGGRCRVFHRSAAGVETEIGGGPFDDGVEFATGGGSYEWVCNVTDQAFAENDRILLKVYVTNVGTMGGPFTCSLQFNGTGGVVFFNVAETVAFKAEAGATSLIFNPHPFQPFFVR